MGMSSPMQALLPVGAVLGCPLGGVMADRVGRKAALQVGAVPGLIGWVLIFVAQYTTNTSTFKSFLLLGRVLAGVGTGMQSTVIPVCTMSCRYSVKLHCMHGSVDYYKHTSKLTYQV